MKASSNTTRSEKDPLGALDVPADALYGVQTLRAVQNFPISGLAPLDPFTKAFDGLRTALEAKGKEFDGIVKAGRTHLQDAMPIRLGQEFTAYAGSIARGLKRVRESADYLRDLGIGGSAVGTGVTV